MTSEVSVQSLHEALSSKIASNASLYEYILNNNTKSYIDLILHKAVKDAGLPRHWHDDAKQEILISWLNIHPDPSFPPRRIFAYASRIAFHKAIEVAANYAAAVAVPPGARRRGQRAYSVPMDAMSVDTGEQWSEWASDMPTISEALIVLDSETNPSEEAVLSGIGAHQIICAGNQGRQSRQRLLIAWMAHGMDIGEIEEFAGIAKRTVYAHIESLREANSDPV